MNYKDLSDEKARSMVEDLFAEFDTNKDGYVYQEEFIAIAIEYFKEDYFPEHLRDKKEFVKSKLQNFFQIYRL